MANVKVMDDILDIQQRGRTTHYRRMASDVVVWLIAIVACILWRWLDDKSEVWSYVALFAGMIAVWVMTGWLMLLYRPYQERSFRMSLLSLIGTALVEIILCHFCIPLLSVSLSPTVAIWMVLIVGAIDTVIIACEHYWKYATNMTVPAMTIEQRENAVVKREDVLRSPESVESIHQSVLSVTNEEAYAMLCEKAHLNSRQTKVVCDRDRFAFLQIPDYQYMTLVDLTLLNDAKGINRRFCIVNRKLPDDGRYVCCYRPQEYMKQKLLRQYPPVIRWVVYTFYFFRKRVLPRMLLTSRLYYDVTHGKKRMLSKTEVLGRLYYCGFEVDEIIPMGHIEYVFAHRKSQPYPQEQIKVYGPLIKLPRVCKNKEIRYFYKFRTMHPYAEYIQKYVFDARGGMDIADKSNDDWRITSWGRVMRKYWLDELPMILNWLKGDVKLVGVRPLSQTMFNSYPEWLQDKRTLVRPGLIPPFYIDHPETFDELFASEDKYLTEYLAHPIRTDIKYFFLTMRSILTRKTHSA